jgi:hypothetical protein
MTKIKTAPIHKIICLAGDRNVIEGQLNSLSIDGWEIIPVSINQSGETVSFTGLAKKG